MTARAKIAFAPLALLLLAGAAQAGDGRNLDLNTPIQNIASRPDGAAVLNDDIPGLLTNENYGMFKGMSLRQVGALSGGKLDHDTLNQTETDLKALPPGPDSGVRRISY